RELNNIDQDVRGVRLETDYPYAVLLFSAGGSAGNLGIGTGEADQCVDHVVNGDAAVLHFFTVVDQFNGCDVCHRSGTTHYGMDLKDKHGITREANLSGQGAKVLGAVVLVFLPLFGGVLNVGRKSTLRLSVLKHQAGKLLVQL